MIWFPVPDSNGGAGFEIAIISGTIRRDGASDVLRHLLVTATMVPPRNNQSFKIRLAGGFDGDIAVNLRSGDISLAPYTRTLVPLVEPPLK